MKEVKELIKRLDGLKLTEREYLELLLAGIREIKYKRFTKRQLLHERN